MPAWAGKACYFEHRQSLDSWNELIGMKAFHFPGISNFKALRQSFIKAQHIIIVIKCLKKKNELSYLPISLRIRAVGKVGC